MSKADVGRFVADARKSKTLQDELHAKGGSVSALIDVGKAHGYQFTTADVRAHLRDQDLKITEAELDRVVGGAVTTAPTDNITIVYVPNKSIVIFK
jgi:hypothetical protein